MKILIVDDDAATRLSLSKILASSAGEIVEAQDGEEAWQLLEAGLRPTICCSDVSMPRLDGMGLVRRAHAHPALKYLPFVMVSAAADQRTIGEAVTHGVSGYVLKPFLAVQTRATVEAVMRKDRSERGEHFLETRRRLGVSLQELDDQLVALKDPVRACARELEAGTEPETERLRLLQYGAHRLGLWRCSELLAQAVAGAMPAGARSPLLRESALLVEDQLLELRQLAPPAY